ncbi:MAG: sugar ABC transporter ATP-binding protein [Planctomycetota bacterium]|jgi:AI-2 transport system ATP-binding protein|nr:sugar ABC transporter ATP-binding protein [Planctomycetota bacterium]
MAQKNASAAPMLSVRNIHKAFGSNEVLKGVDLDVHPGEAVALIGGNGAGKSTLVKIIMGIYQPDRGDVFIAGNKVSLNNPSAALAQGVYLVPQEPMLFPNMSVEENVILGFEEKTADLRKRLLDFTRQMKWEVDLSRKAISLSIAEQQLVEILRGLMRDSRILILDEPTSALTFDEVESLFRVIGDLKAKGISIIYITHRLTEVFTIAARVAIMRDGVITLNGPVGDFTRDDLVKGLLPPDAQENERGEKRPVPECGRGKPVFSLIGFTGYGFADIDLDVHRGEILGLAGVVGAGRTELATTIFGRDEVLRGKAILNGEDITGLSTPKVIEKGINYVPEDRFLNGIYKISDVAANTSSARLYLMGKVFLKRRDERELTNSYVKDFRIKITSQEQSVGSLSGGNQQKVVLARALSTNPKLVILDEPTRGIDAAARGDVYAIINRLKAEGVAILLISSDMEEIVELSDRAIAMYHGRINREFEKDRITQDNLMAAAFGAV